MATCVLHKESFTNFEKEILRQRIREMLVISSTRHPTDIAAAIIEDVVHKVENSLPGMEDTPTRFDTRTVAIVDPYSCPPRYAHEIDAHDVVMRSFYGPSVGTKTTIHMGKYNGTGETDKLRALPTDVIKICAGGAYCYTANTIYELVHKEALKNVFILKPSFSTGINELSSERYIDLMLGIGLRVFRKVNW